MTASASAVIAASANALTVASILFSRKQSRCRKSSRLSTYEHHCHLRTGRAAAVPPRADLFVLEHRQARRYGQACPRSPQGKAGRVRRNSGGGAPPREALVGIGRGRRLCAARRGP